MVKNKNGKWQMCTDFTDVNKCSPKDDFSLTRTDQIIDFATASETMALLDCFSRYHKSGFTQKTKKRPVSSLYSEHTATSE
jgi:hypothetical protein